MREADFRLTVNGAERRVTCEPDTPLLDVLRHDLGLAGSRFGCGIGLCGACFVLIDGRARSSCDLPVSAVGGPVITVEGLPVGGRLQAFIPSSHSPVHGPRSLQQQSAPGHARPQSTACAPGRPEPAHMGASSRLTSCPATRPESICIERLASSRRRRSPIVTAPAASWSLRTGTSSGRPQPRWPPEACACTFGNFMPIYAE
jgi:hypothetical protein